jgi:hypothetical protein
MESRSALGFDEITLKKGYSKNRVAEIASFLNLE